MASSKRIATNRLLDALPALSGSACSPRSETVELTFADVIYVPGDVLDHVYFPLEALISLIVPIEGSAGLEVGLVGNEGMFGIPLVLGVDVSSLRAVVQGSGAALRMDAALFGVEIATQRNVASRDRSLCVRAFERTRADSRVHAIPRRRSAARAVAAHDAGPRPRRQCFNVTQEFLALMLGVRRVGVTRAAGSLQKLGLIQYSRGKITVLDRRGLKAAACACYGADRAAYARVFG